MSGFRTVRRACMPLRTMRSSSSGTTLGAIRNASTFKTTMSLMVDPFFHLPFEKAEHNDEHASTNQ